MGRQITEIVQHIHQLAREAEIAYWGVMGCAAVELAIVGYLLCRMRRP